METDEKRRGKDAAALSGGHLCHVCGYQYPNPHPSAKLRRSHRKHCGKAPPAAAVVVEEEESAVEGLRVSEREERNAGDGTLLGENGGGVVGKTEANGCAALLGSAREAGESVGDKAIAEHSSSNGIGVHQVTHELNENGQINCMNSEDVSPDDKATNSEFSRNGLVDCSSNSEHVSKGNGVELPIACTSGRQDKVAKHCFELASVAVPNPAEREDSFDEYQDASPFLPQSDSEDGAAPSLEFPIETNNLKNVLSGSSVAANEISLGTNGLCKDQASGELSLSDLSAGSKVGNDSENGTLSMAGPQASLKLGLPYGSYVNVGSNHADMVDNKPDKIFHNSESIGDPEASPLQEAQSIGLDTDSQSTCTRKMHGVTENAVHALHNLYEASTRPEAAESSNVQLETVTDSSTSTMPLGNELKVVHTENNPKQNWSVMDASDVQRPVEGLCLNNLCSKAAFQNNLPPATNVDDTLYSTNDCCSDMDFTFEARTQPDIVEQVSVSEENPFVQKTSGSTEEEVCNRQIDPEVPTEDQFPKSHKHDELQVDQTSCVKNPFDLDDPRNDDLFELPTDSCYLELPGADVSRQQLDSASVTVDQPTVSNQTTMAEAQHNHNSNEYIQPASSSGENGHPVGPKDTPVCSSAKLVTDTHWADGPLNHRLQEDDAPANGIPFVLSQVAPMEFRTACTQDTSALSTGVENMQTEDVTAVPTTDNTEMKQADDTTAMDTYAIKVETKKLTEDTAAKMDEVQHCNFEEKQADSTKVSAVQNISNVEENKPTEGTTMKEMNAQVNGNDLEGKRQTDDTNAEKMNDIGCTDNFEEKICVQTTSTKEMIAAQSTENVEENKQENTIVRQEGNNQKEEIAGTGGRLNSGRIHVPLKVLLAEASAENKVHKPSAKERVLSFRRRVSKNDNSSPKPGSPKSGSDGHQWNSPAKLPRKDTDKSSKGRKQPWMPFICCHSVR